MKIALAILLLAVAASAADRNCDLLKADEANAALGTNLGPGVPSTSDDGKPVCKYTAPDETTLIVAVAEKRGKAALAAQKESGSENPGKMENVPGVGDEALLQVFSIGGGAIGVRRGDAFFAILIASHHKVPVREGLLQLARKAITRL